MANTCRKRDAACVGAGEPAKSPTRWLAPATPMFAGAPAPTRARLIEQVMDRSIGAGDGLHSSPELPALTQLRLHAASVENHQAVWQLVTRMGRWHLLAQ
ncbi:hypothetical protein FYM84_03745 [Pseudomonas sp. CAH-1]|nr:hypothetical protein [Pseudomonas sp. CAH-1]